jgi:flagellar motor protein MotB
MSLLTNSPTIVLLTILARLKNCKMNRKSNWLFETPLLLEWEKVPDNSARSQAIRETISGFSRYSQSAKLLPPKEQQKIDKVARLIIERFKFRRQPIRVRLIGHADKDSPRRPTFEKKIGGDRALEIQNTIIQAIDNSAITAKIVWERISMGATQPIVPKTVNERGRLRNRRVEIMIEPAK